MVKLVLFDIDGTLISTGGAGMKAFDLTLEQEFGVRERRDRIQFGGRTDPSLVREILTGNSIEATSTHQERFLRAYLDWLPRLMNQCQGFMHPGVRELLDGLRALPQPPVIGLLTGNIRAGAEIKLRHFGIWEEFEFGGFGDDGEDRNLIAQAAHGRGNAHLGEELPGEAIVVVGDTRHDVTCGRAIGAKVLAVATGAGSFEELEACRPDWTVRSMAGLDPALICQ